MRPIWFKLSFLFGLASICLAQGTGSIHGVVIDPSGLPIEGAKVTALLVERGVTRTVQADLQGTYLFPELPVGHYQLLFAHTGFKELRAQAIELTANENVRVDGKLELGSVSESVQVTATAAGVDTRSSANGTLIDSRRVTELPINGRNILSLAAILPGVSNITAPQEFTNTNLGPTMNVNGSRVNANQFLFDGVPYNQTFRNRGFNYPPPDALQEVKILTNSFSAEYGRNSGSILNVLTRSGTNEIHGTLWEFLRNNQLNARNFFSGSSAAAQLIQNQFGASAGGPIRKNSLFIFGAYEGLRVRQASLVTGAFPLTAAERAGTFPSAVRDPQNGNQPFAGNLIPIARLDPVARKLADPSVMPLPNQPNGSYVATSPSPVNNEDFLTKLDYNHGNHSFDLRYNYINTNEANVYVGQVPSYLSLSQKSRTHAITAGETFVITPTILNQFRFGFMRVESPISSKNPTPLASYGSNFPVVDNVPIPPNLQISGRVTLGKNSSTDTIQINQNIDVSDSVTVTHGKHSVKMGFEFLRPRYVNRGHVNTMGSFSFTGASSGNAAADFLLGYAASLTVGSPRLEQIGNSVAYYGYVQDDWRVLSRLTLNLGLRYELPMPWIQPNNWWGTFSPGRQSTVISTAPTGMLFPKDTGIPRGLIQTDKNNFAPRLGFAWDVRGNGRTAVRGAYGIFYETLNADLISNNSQPFFYQYTLNGVTSLVNPLGGLVIPATVNVTNPQFVGTQTVVFPDPLMRLPYVHHVSLNVQQNMPGDWVLQAGYLGKIGIKQMTTVDDNAAPYAAGATAANIDKRRPYQGFGANLRILGDSNSNYHSLQVEGRKRMSHGFTIQGAYTYSKSLDNFSGGAAGSASIPYPWNRRSDYGPSSYDLKHIGSLSWLWNLPGAGRNVNWLLSQVTSGWQVNGLLMLQSGSPINVTAGTDQLLSGTPNQRANVVGDWRLSSDRSQGDKILAWFNRLAFAQPPIGTLGNVSRDALVGPGSEILNLGIFRQFRVTERAHLQFRSEFFNALNHTNLGSPNAAVNAGARMGLITSAGDARVIQFALKALF